MSSDVPVSEDLSNQILKELQSWWEVPSIAQYISLFRESFHLPEIEIEELENGLIEDTTKGPNSWLQDLLISFLRSIMPGRVNNKNWENEFQKLVKRKWPIGQENPFPPEKSFFQLSLRSKVEIIYSLCLYRLDRNDIGDVMKSMDADALRVQKLGVDDTGNTYWYFYGTRLYKEEGNKEKNWDEEWKDQKKKTFKKKRGRGRPRKIRRSDGESDDFEDLDAKNNDGYMNANKKSRWSVVCDTIEEWVNFAEKFKDSKSKNEKALFQIVQENFLPTLNKIYEEKEKKLQQKLKELMPVREKVVTRRETRKQRGEVFEFPTDNGYEDEAHRLHMVKDRARRLEERNKQTSEGTYRASRKKLRYLKNYETYNPQSKTKLRYSAKSFKRAGEGSYGGKWKRLKYSDYYESYIPQSDTRLGYSVISFKRASEGSNGAKQKKLRYSECYESYSPQSVSRLRYSGRYEGTSSQAERRQSYSEMYDSTSPRSESSLETDENSWALLQKSDDKKMDLQSQMERLMSGVKLHKDAWPFLYPVADDDAPGYYEIIKDPIDLSVIGTRLYEGHYETVGELDADFAKMVSNCELYNGENHAYSKMVKTLYKMFRKDVAKILATLPEECSNAESEENSNGTSLVLSSPHIRSSKKPKEGRRKKSKSKVALEMLAHASEVAIQNSNSNDRINESNMYDGQKKSNDFSNLKVMPINSHPPSLIEKFASDSSNEGLAENEQSYGNYSSYLNQEIINGGQYDKLNPNEATIPVSNESANYVSNNLTHLSNFIEKNKSKALNFLSNNDVTHILSDHGSTHENSDNSSISESASSYAKDDENSNNLDQSFDNILECNDNVSNIISQIIKQPIYSPDNQLVPESSKDRSASAYSVNLPKQNASLNKSSRKSPPATISSLLSHAAAANVSLIQDPENVQPGLGSTSNNITTIDASAIGISSYALPKNTNSSISLMKNQQNFNNNESHGNAIPNVEYEEAFPKSSPPLQPKPHRLSPNELLSNQYYETSDILNYQQASNVPNVTHQSLNMNVPMPVNSQTTFATSVTNNSNSSIPLQIPAVYPKAVQQQAKIQIQPQNNIVRVNAPPPGAHIVVVSDANSGSGVTYHVYAQSKMDQIAVEESINYHPGSTSTVTSKPDNRVADNQENVVNRTPPSQKKSPVSFQLQAASNHVPSKNLPYSPSSKSTSTISRMSLPVTSSNFVPVNSFMSPTRTDKPTIIRTKALDTNPHSNATTSYNMNSNVNESYNTTAQNNVYQTLGSKTFPMVFSGFNQQSPSNQTDMRFKNNPGTTIRVPSNLCMPNGMPILQQVLIPSGAQQIQVQNGGQLVFASPQNTVNRTFLRENAPIQNNVRQMSQNFATKVVPQMVSPTSIMQVNKDMMQSLQLQAISQNGPQTFTQQIIIPAAFATAAVLPEITVAQSPQFMNIPTYMIANQNQVQATSAQPMINMQQYQLSQRQQMQINGQGNG